jgi:hypothetical protein
VLEQLEMADPGPPGVSEQLPAAAFDAECFGGLGRDFHDEEVPIVTRSSAHKNTVLRVLESIIHRENKHIVVNDKYLDRSGMTTMNSAALNPNKL